MDKVSSQESDTFVAGNVLGVSLNFHPGNLRATRHPGLHQQYDLRGSGRVDEVGMVVDQSNETQRVAVRHRGVPEASPGELFYNFNYILFLFRSVYQTACLPFIQGRA